MAMCRDCGQPAGNATLCDACEAVEVALAPRRGPFVEPLQSTISFPLLAPERDAPARHRAALWVAVGVAVLAVVAAVLYAWRMRVR